MCSPAVRGEARRGEDGSRGDRPPVQTVRPSARLEAARATSIARVHGRTQVAAELWRVIERPHIAIRRLPPDAVQVQIVIGSLLGDARFEGRPGQRQVRIAHASSRAAYVWWKYERLGAFAASPPSTCDDRTTFDTIVHPLFDDLASLDRPGLLRLVEPLGLAVWLADKGRLQLEIGSFLPRQRAALYGIVAALSG